MPRLLAKLVALGAFSMFTFSMYAPDDLTAAWVVGGVMFFLGLASFSKTIAVLGNGETPGIIPMFTILFLVGPICLFHLLPMELYEFGLSKRVPTNSREDVMLILFSSVLMALYIWIPLLSYYLIDSVFNRLGRRPEQAA